MKQNLVFIMTDQQRADTLGMNGGGGEVTPHLNRLSRESTVFSRAYNTCPLCVPARTALATGINPIKNGMMLNDLPGNYARDHHTIHQMLFEAGYEVAHIGVNHISVKPGLFSSGMFSVWEDDDTYAAYAWDKGLDVKRKPEQVAYVEELSCGAYEKHGYSNTDISIWPYELEDFKDVWFTSQAITYLERDHEKPFALFLYLWAPHPPLVIPKEYWDPIDEAAITLPPGTGECAQGEPEGRRRSAARQLGEIPPQRGWKAGWHAHLALSRLCDDQVGRVREALRRKGLEDDTVIVFTTDHGEHMGQHRMYQKMEMYEAAVRVPAIFHVPGAEAHSWSVPVSHLDFVPTLIQLLNLAPRPELEGCSLGDSITGGKEPEERPVFGVYCGNHQFGDMRRMIIKGNYKYIFDNREEELYDLAQDPCETVNLSGEEAFAEIKDSLYRQLEQWALSQGDPFFTAKGKKKNLVFVFADQWRRDAMGFAGRDPVKTPNMDSFAEHSVYCTNGISTFPLCSPHRASLLTGKHPLHTGIFTNCKTGLEMGLGEDEICIGDVLKSSGYETGYIGKWHLDEPDCNRSDHPESGAQRWDAFTPPGPRRHGFDFWYSYGAWDEHLTPHYWRDTPEPITVNRWSPIHETDVALDFIRNRDGDRPFALFLSWNPPHSPYDMVPEEYLDFYRDEDIVLRENVDLQDVHHHTYEPAGYDSEGMIRVIKEYYAAVSGLDDQFGRLIKELKELGLYDDTVIVLSADHGDMMGSHGLIGKHVWYEESIGIPLVVGGAGLPAGSCQTLVGSPDVMPTILGLLGIPIPETVEGTDCSPDIKGFPAHKDHVCYLGACPGRDVFLKAFEEAGKDPRDFGWRGIRTSRYVYVAEVGYEVVPDLRRYLYDLKEDPFQQHPVMGKALWEHPTARELEEKLCHWLREQKDGFLVHLTREAGKGDSCGIL